MGIFDVFKPSKLSVVLKEMKREDLSPQAMLLKSGARSGYSVYTSGEIESEHWMKKEVEMLKKQNVNILAAMTSGGRFTKAKEICEKHNLLEGAKFMDNYSQVYMSYIKQLQDDAGGGPVFF